MLNFSDNWLKYEQLKYIWRMCMHESSVIAGLGMKAGPVMDEGGGGEGLPSPKLVLYPPGKIRLEWPGVRRVGAGLVNLGNTCFLNSTLQCLTYCPPLANYLLSGEHASCCKLIYISNSWLAILTKVAKKIHIKVIYLIFNFLVYLYR